MSVLRPRNRLVNFRLSEDEFEKLKAACETHGARSISDFARTSVLDRMEQAPAPAGSAQGRLVQLGHKVSELESRVGQLLQLMEVTGDSVSPETLESVRLGAGRTASGA